MNLNYNLHLKKKKQRKYHCYDHLTIEQLPHIGEHIIVEDIKYRIVDVEHHFSNTIIHGATTLMKSEQLGNIYADEVA